jgi:hypothetical protein
MNEHIKELVGQAKFMAEEITNKKISANAELYVFAEKFAELIVRDIVFGLRDNADCLAVTGSVNEAFMFRTYATGLEKQYGIKE